MNFLETTQRQEVLQEAISWLKTPYHLNARIKGSGVDCGSFLVACFHNVGLIDDPELDRVTYDFNLHRGDEVYLKWVIKYCNRVSSAKPGDLILYKYGRIISHGGIVVDDNQIIHATKDFGVIYGEIRDEKLKSKQFGVYRLKGWSTE